MTIWQSILTVAAFAVVQVLVTIGIGRFMRSRNFSIKYPDYLTYHRPEPDCRRGVGDLPGRAPIDTTFLQRRPYPDATDSEEE